MRALGDLSLEPTYPSVVHYGSAVKDCKGLAQEGIFMTDSKALGYNAQWVFRGTKLKGTENHHCKN